MRIMNHDLEPSTSNHKIQRNVTISIPSLPATMKIEPSATSNTLRPTVASSSSSALSMSASSSSFSSANLPANGASAGAGGQQTGQQIAIQKIPGLSVFLTKIYNIFSIREYSDKDWCCWGANGDTIVFKSIEQFSKNVLPKYFKHSNFQSFVRQLNMYDFRKTAQNPNHVEFQHTYFKRNQPELLINIKRKPSRLKTLQYKTDLASRGIAMPSSGLHVASSAGDHAYRKSDGRKSGGSAGHGVDSEIDYEEDDDGEDEFENEHDEYFDGPHDAGGGHATGRGVRGLNSTGASQMEARIATLEAESSQLKTQVESLQWQSAIFRSILDEIFILLSRQQNATTATTTASSSTASSSRFNDKIYAKQLEVPRATEPTLFTNDFVDDVKQRIYETVIDKMQLNNRSTTTYPNISNQVHGVLYPYPSSSSATAVAFNDVIAGASAYPIGPIGGMDFGMSLENKLPSEGLHAFDGMELSRLRTRADTSEHHSDLVMQPTSFDLAASSVHQPSSIQIGRLNSFFGAEFPSASFSRSSLELLSTSADILTERDRMSSYDYSNFASASAAATVVSDEDRLPLSKKQRNSDGHETGNIPQQPIFAVDGIASSYVLKTEASSSSLAVAAEIPAVGPAIIGPSATASEENHSSGQEPLGPSNLIRLESTFTNLSRLDSLDSAISKIFKNSEDSTS